MLINIICVIFLTKSVCTYIYREREKEKKRWEQRGREKEIGAERKRKGERGIEKSTSRIPQSLISDL